MWQEKADLRVLARRRVRPHWWVLLAVSLALLALVAATSANRPSTPERHDLARASAARHDPEAKDPSPTTTAPATVTSTTLPPVTATTTTTLAAPPVATQAAKRESASATPANSTVVATTTTTTTTAPSPAGAVAASTQTGETNEPINGSLQQPDDASNALQFQGDEPTVISVSWAPATTLSLTVSCATDVQTEQGTSSITVDIPQPEGPCTAVIRELQVQYAAVSYSGSIGPESG